MDRVISRRKLLSATALGWAGVGAAIAAAPRARALTLEEPAQPVADQYLAARAACRQGGEVVHARIIAYVQAELARQHVPTDQRQRIISGMTCPLCSCPLS